MPQLRIDIEKTPRPKAYNGAKMNDVKKRRPNLPIKYAILIVLTAIGSGLLLHRKAGELEGKLETLDGSMVESSGRLRDLESRKDELPTAFDAMGFDYVIAEPVDESRWHVIPKMGSANPDEKDRNKKQLVDNGQSLQFF